MSRTTAATWTGVRFPCDTNATDPAVLAEAQRSAQDWLFTLSGGRVGVFTTVDDEYRMPCYDQDHPYPYKDRASGEWRNGRLDREACERIELFRQPVTAITEVRLDGNVLDPAEYRLEGSTLVRVGSCWPTVSDDAPPAIVVDYTWGVAPGSTALLACGELTCEFAAALSGDDCSLPERATQIVRQGVTVSLPDVESAMQGTDLKWVNRFVQTYNPRGHQTRARVVNPDMARRAV